VRLAVLLQFLQPRGIGIEAEDLLGAGEVEWAAEAKIVFEQKQGHGNNGTCPHICRIHWLISACMLP